jgi:chemotaxis protein MotB
MKASRLSRKERLMIMRTNRQLVIGIGTVVSTILVAGCVTKSKYEALEAENRQLRQEISTQKAQVGRLQGAIKYTVNSDLLFAPGKWEIKEAGKNVIAKLAVKLAPSQQNHLVVNGYTDNAPIGPALKKEGVTTNEELSQKRAESVMQYLLSQGFRPDLVSAHGYGEANPVAPNTTAKGRSENRRVELTLGGAS